MDFCETSVDKRPRTNAQHVDQQWHFDDVDDGVLNNALDEVLAQASLYALPQTDPPAAPGNHVQGHARKRMLDDAETVNDFTSALPSIGENDPLRELFPELFPRLPSATDRHLVQLLENPFLEDRVAVTARHVALRPVAQANTGVVNGYIKCVMWSETPSSATEPERLSTNMATHHRSVLVPPLRQTDHVARLPPEFGSGANIDATDRKLLKFYISAICSGRTLLLGSNAWLDLGSVIDSDDCARHAALAFSAGYLLDYVPSEKLRVRANYHYKRATELLSLALADPSIHGVGKEDSVVTAMHMMWSDDIVQWELRRAKEEIPRWRRATQIATQILDSSDPGYRYWRSENVQVSNIRRANAKMCAYAEVCALPVTELQVQSLDKLYSWLLEGSEEDVRTVYGGTGVSPKVMHTFAQITQLSARLAKDPKSMFLPHAADEVAARLTNFRQISELSRGHDTPDALLKSCELDEHGLVRTAREVTELTAETWVQAARIYLCCRFYRLPRSHPKVLSSLSILLRCIERMPTSGALFTAQSPFFCVFMGALVAERDEDRRVLTDWFDVIVSSASGRSSVPPIYDMIKSFWRWIDAGVEGIPQIDYEEGVPIHEREPWWERMVDWILQCYGQLSLV